MEEHCNESREWSKRPLDPTERPIKALLRECQVFRVPTAHPADISGVLDLIATATVAAPDIRAIFGKTEGNGCVNDFTRAYAVTALQAGLAPHLNCAPAEVGQHIAMVMSGGTEGGLSPHLLVFAASPAPTDAKPDRSSAIATAVTRDFLPEEIGRMAQIDATAEAVTAAIAQAGIIDPEDVHYVQIKCPLLTSERVLTAAARGQSVATEDTYASMRYSRGASALGVALALGEVAREALNDDAVCRRLDLWSGRASTSAGIELMHNEVIVLGNSNNWASDAVISHRVMQDAIDLPGGGWCTGRRRARFGWSIAGGPVGSDGAGCAACPPGEGRSGVNRPHPRCPPYHAGRQRHQCDSPCAGVGGRRVGRVDRPHRFIRLRRCRAPRAGRRRPGGSDRSADANSLKRIGCRRLGRDPRLWPPAPTCAPGRGLSVQSQMSVVARPQLRFQQLSGRGVRQAVDHHHVVRHPPFGDMRRQEVEN